MIIIARDDYDYYYGGYYSQTAFIVKWVIVGLIFLAFIVFILGGYLHAQRRMKKGQPPLRYHRWMVSRAQRERFFPPAQNNFSFYNQGQPQGHGYPMQPWTAPPPAYGDQGYVPPYPGAPGASKAAPNQTYTPPTGPPPAQAHTAAASNQASSAQDSGRVYPSYAGVSRPDGSAPEVSR